MGSSVLGFALRTTLGVALSFLWSPGLLAQVPLPAAPPRPDSAPAAPASPPANEPAMPPPPAAPGPPSPAAAPPAARPPTPAPPPPGAASEPPPLDPPPDNPEPPQRPGFLHTRAEMERIKGDLPARERRPTAEPEPAAPLAASPESAVDFVRRSSPWVDFSLTNFWMDDRVGNFLNFGVQIGGYFFNRLRLSGRLVAPLEEVNDDYYSYSDYSGGASGTYNTLDSRKVSVLYGVSAGLMVTNSRAFVFGPGVTLLRTDVEAYGTAIYLTLPFEWTTRRNLRIGFELGLGRAVGGKVRKLCRNYSTSPATPCGIQPIDRPDGTALLAQFYMGWSLGSL